MRSIFLLFGLFVFLVSQAQQGSVTLQAKSFQYNPPRDTAIWNWLERQPGFSSLPLQQQESFYWTNLMRRNPIRFFETAVRAFVQQFPEANTREVRDLELDIKKAPVTLPLLAPDASLKNMGAAHTTDLVMRGGIISHQSASGKGFAQRIKEFGSFRCGAENIYAGSNDPLEALIILLIDHNVPNKGHRINLLDPAYGRMGLGWELMKDSRAMLVQVFACP
ncbi:MAG TPA: CAP domain-containing protein [Lacibacter sp.]|nr:CAP domain-containing protein [Lacibacter sp.]HMO90094.1 CAP domain-containing protein [Lacibacter sp.]HMP86889.1 CAP domain-containing protein [Lacibacter sp.]